MTEVGEEDIARERAEEKGEVLVSVLSRSGLNDRMKSITEGTSVTALSQTAVTHAAHQETHVAGAAGEDAKDNGGPR